MKIFRWIIGSIVIAGAIALIIKRPLPFLFYYNLPPVSFYGRGLYILILACVLCLLRIWWGPTGADRVVAVDIDVNLYDPNDVNWAIATRFNPDRDLILLKNRTGHILNPMVTTDPDGKGGTVTKMGMDATNKWPGETSREWGRPIRMTEEVKVRVDALWDSLNLTGL